MASTSKKGSNDQELVELQRALLSGPTVGVPHNEADEEVTRAFMARRADQREHYGQWTANQDIYDPMGNTLVFTRGMAVPVEHVEKWDLEAVGMVDRVASADEARKGFAGSNLPGPAAVLSQANTSSDKPATA